jgi:hypothetical protein
MVFRFLVPRPTENRFGFGNVYDSIYQDLIDELF